MLKQLRDIIIERVRQRVSEGDCPTIPPESVEILEEVIMDLTSSPVAAPAPIAYESLQSLIGELGNQIHNLACEYQRDEALTDRLAELRSEAWRLARLAQAAPLMQGEGRAYPDLLSDDQCKQILADAEQLWRDLEGNNLGGFGGHNRPFYILHEFKRVIERYGRRDVGLTWSKDELDAALQPTQPKGDAK